MPQWIWLIVLGVLVVLMFLLSMRQRKMQAQQLENLDKLKEGDKVKTHLGIYATLIRTYDSTDGKIAVLEIGDKNKVQFEMQIRYVAGVDDKTEVVFDEPAEEITAEEIEKTKEEIKDKLDKQKEQAPKNEDGSKEEKQIEEQNKKDEENDKNKV